MPQQLSAGCRSAERHRQPGRRWGSLPSSQQRRASGRRAAIAATVSRDIAASLCGGVVQIFAAAYHHRHLHQRLLRLGAGAGESILQCLEIGDPAALTAAVVLQSNHHAWNAQKNVTDRLSYGHHVQSAGDQSAIAGVALLQALVPALLMNICIVGLNQLYDIDIDRVNKPYLPLASGELSEQQVWCGLTPAALKVVFEPTASSAHTKVPASIQPVNCQRKSVYAELPCKHKSSLKESKRGQCKLFCGAGPSHCGGDGVGGARDRRRCRVAAAARHAGRQPPAGNRVLHRAALHAVEAQSGAGSRLHPRRQVSMATGVT